MDECAARTESSLYATRCCADEHSCAPTFEHTTSPPTPIPTSPSPLPTPAPSPPPTTSPPSPAPTASVAAVTCSAKSCSQLGLLKTANGYDQMLRGSDGVCGGSSGFNVSQPCSGEVSWMQAREFCEGVGARMCTEKELRQNEVKGSGCSVSSCCFCCCCCCCCCCCYCRKEREKL